MARRTVREITDEGRLSAELIRLFMAEHLRFTGGRWAGRPFTLEPWQYRDIVLPVFGHLDARGHRRYKEAIIGLPRWCGKSQLCAGLGAALFYCEPTYEGEYYVVATTKRQAQIVFDKVKRMVLGDPLLRGITKPYRQVLEIPETGAIFRVLPWDADTTQGLHPTVCIIDEYHVHRDASMREAMVSGMVGTRDGLMVTISTAGPERKGPLWELLKTAPRDPRAHLHWVGASDEEDGHDPKVWRKANPARWITLKMLRDQYRNLPFPVFERYHLNRFPSLGTNRAYPADWVDRAEGHPELDPSRPTMLALDASWTRDTTALVLDQRDERGRHHAWGQVWKSDRAMGHIDHEAVEAKIVELCQTFNVVRIGADPNYFTRSMLRLEHDFRLPIEEFPQENKRMSAACMNLYDVLQEDRLSFAAHPDVSAQLKNAAVKATAYGWRITKATEDEKIDAAIATSIAVYLAEAEAHAFAPSFAETGGVWTIGG